MKKKVILIGIIIVLIILDIYLLYNIYTRYKNKQFIEQYDIPLAQDINNSDFKIDKVILYSSASGINKNSNFQNQNWILDIFEYTDIAIYFSKPEKLTAKNTVNSLSISNINFTTNSDKYSPELYYLDANNFGTDKFSKEQKIENNLEYTVLNSDNSENSIMYNTPVFFSDLSNPITLKLTNVLLKNYSINNTEKLTFDGSLLTKVPVSKKNLNASISFNINVSNFEGDQYIAPVNIKIPIETANESIFDGKVLETQNVNLMLLKE